MPISGPAVYLGQVGSTGRSTAPHSHKEVIDLRTGKTIPLSQTRSDIGQRIQFRVPGSQTWEQLYKQTGAGQFQLSPNAPLTSEKGMRTHPVTGQQAYHYGEDYGLPKGTDLRFVGPGSVTSAANYGNAGNVSRLTTGDNRYRLDIFHLDKLPGEAKVGSSEVPSAPQLPPTPDQNTDTLMASLFGKQDSLKDLLTTSLLQQALARKQETAVANPYKSLNSTLQQAMESFA